MPSDDKEAFCLLVLSLGSTALLSLLILMAVFFFQADIINFSGQPRIADYLYFFPLGAFLVGVFSSFQYWAIRKKNFKAVAKTRLSQSISSAVTQVGLGFSSASPLGLILGYVVNIGSGSLGLCRAMCQTDGALFKTTSALNLKVIFQKYERFPKLSAPEALANSAAIQVPVIIIASYALGSEAGFLLLGMRVMQAPLGVIGQAISQVYLSRASEEYRRNNLDKFTLEVFAGLFRAGVGPLLFAGVVAPNVFGFVFGPQWIRSGELVSWMALWYVFQFLSSPLSMALQVTRSQGVALGLQIFGFVLRVSSVIVAAKFFGKDFVSEAYAISGAVFYAIYLVVILKVLSISFFEAVKVVQKCFPIFVGWLCAAYLFVFLSSKVF